MAENKLYPERTYRELTRIDILYGFTIDYPQFPCDICNKKECRGEKGKCKGFGAWSYGVKL